MSSLQTNNEKEAIQALMKNGGVNKAGSLFRVGISVVNCRVVLDTLWQTKEQQEKRKGREGMCTKCCRKWKVEFRVGCIRQVVWRWE